MKEINLQNEDRKAEIYTKLEKIFPGSKVVEVQARYSNWFCITDASENFVLVRTVLKYQKNIVQLLIVNELASIFEYNLHNEFKKNFPIYEYDISRTKSHWDFNAWVEKDPDRTRECSSSDSYLNVRELLLLASQEMKKRGK